MNILMAFTNSYKQVILYTFQLLFNSTGFGVFGTFLSAASHFYSKQALIQVGSPN